MRKTRLATHLAVDAAAFDIAADGTVTFNVAPDYGCACDPQPNGDDDGNGGTATQSVMQLMT